MVGVSQKGMMGRINSFLCMNSILILGYNQFIRSVYMEVNLTDVMKRLDLWRHYPKYQLERHFDVIFSFLLPDFILRKYKNRVIKIIPEFPIPKRLLKYDYNGNDCENIDFACFSRRGKTYNIYLIEFKTDESSNRDSQDETLEKLHKLDFNDIIVSLFEIIKKSKNQRKYLLLLQDLNMMGITKVEPEFFKRVINKNRYRNKLLTQNRIVKNTYNIIPIKITPSVSYSINQVNAYSFIDFYESSNSLRVFLEKWVRPPQEDTVNYLIDGVIK